MTKRSTLINGIRSVIDDVAESLPAEVITEAKDFLDYDEWGLALETICTQLYEYDVAISDELYKTIERLGQQMKMSSEEWTMLKELVQ
jgi:hypothetical protein